MNLTETNDVILTESKTLRNDYVYKDVVLDKVKFVSTLGKEYEVTLEMVADFYEANIETIRQIIKRNRDEFNDYEEMRVLKGRTLNDFKAMVQDVLPLKSINSLTLLNRRGMLRVGMLLTESEIAKTVRHYLLNVEQIAPKELQQWAIEREISRRERKALTDAIKDFFIGGLKQGFEYSTFTNLVYKVIFDSNAKQMMEYYGLDKNDPLRDSLSTEDLRKVVAVEKTISALIRLGKDYHYIKEELLHNKERFQ